MDRRETIKSLLVGSVAGTVALSPLSCEEKEAINKEAMAPAAPGTYGRTPKEKQRDALLLAQDSVFTIEEMTTITLLSTIILPATSNAKSAQEAGVPEFIDFIVKDIPSHQLPLKGGLMWLNREANLRFAKPFAELSISEQTEIVDDIAYPESARPEMQPGVAFFNRMRNLTLTAYYTSKIGIEDLGYQGNRANVWDGVPEEVLQDHDVEYDPAWIAKCVDQSKRTEIAQWDEEGNLLT